MSFTTEGAFFKDENALLAIGSLTEEQMDNLDELAAVGLYEAVTSNKTIKPGKTATLTYKIDRKVSYSARSILASLFKYNKKLYCLYAGWDLGSDCERLQ